MSNWLSKNRGGKSASMRGGPSPNGHDIGCHNFSCPAIPCQVRPCPAYIVKNMSPINEGMGKRATWENVFFARWHF